MKYRFIGHEAGIGSLSLTRFGQLVELPDDTPASSIKRAMLIPDEKFSGLDFTEDELRAYQNPGSHPDAPEEFQAKKAAAIKIFQEEE